MEGVGGGGGGRGGAAISRERSSDKSCIIFLTKIYQKIHTYLGWQRMKQKTMFNMLLFKKNLLK